MMHWLGGFTIPLSAPLLVLGAHLAGWLLRRHPNYCEQHGDLCPVACGHNGYRCWRWADNECDGLARLPSDGPGKGSGGE